MKKLSNKKKKETLNLIRTLENRSRGEEDKEKLTSLRNQIYKLRESL